MSKREKQNASQSAEKQEGGQKPEKIVTRYDRRMQRRKEQKQKELRDKRMGQIIGAVLAVALVCVVASFPVRTWMNLNGTYIQVNGDKVTKVEYDYNYNLVSNSFISQYYTTYLYYFGVDLSGDLSKQMYSDTLTWKDHFDELTVERLAQNKSMMKEAKEAGFAHDTDQEYADFMEDLKDAAETEGMSLKNYIQQMYGAYATESRIKPYVEEGIYLSAYNGEVLEERYAPSDEEIQEYYESNKANYDSVDYYLHTVNAELPTEPTELADPVDENEDGEEGSDGEDGSAGEETPYQPSEAEIAAAMEAAKDAAEAVEKKVETVGELNTNMKKASITYSLQSWLFDEERKAGDTTVIEDATSHRYYVLGFEDRYLDKARSADARILMTKEDGQAVLDEWKNGAATEESFAEICDKYRDPAVSTAKGGLYEALVSGNMEEELKVWVFDEGRKAGDTAVITPEGSEYTYVAYYIAPNEEEWYLSIRQTLLNERLTEYMEGLAENADVKDPKGNLNFRKVQEEAAKAQLDKQDGSGENQSAEDGSEDNSSEGSDMDGSAEPSGDGDGSGSGEGSASGE
ncbi:MAG: hypothetical protein HFH90_05645 [Lachnospiraceae bacterium]|jgi:hypothetical protein|nr:hypothetical protein [Lachnospiraceae bacterium]